jgi:hypothetical protein
MVNRMLMRRSAPQPRSRKTPRGGRMMAMMILMMSLRGGSVRVVACVPRAASADRSPRKRRRRGGEETHDPVKAMLTVFEVVVGWVVKRCGWWSGCMWIAEMRDE